MKRFIRIFTFVIAATLALDSSPALPMKQNACADQKIAAQLCSIGARFQNLGGVENEKKAVIYYQASATRGFAKAKFNLGYCYENGIGIDKDEKIAIPLYQEAVNQNLVYAQFQLGKCYLYGVGVNKDVKKAEELFVAAHNNPTLKESKLSRECKRLINQLATPTECPLCLGLMQLMDNNLSCTQCCSYLVHTDCITPWLSKEMTCPFCRQKPTLYNI